ncbi:GGDEF domain-containing protein [Erythrobacter sp. SCSIO 43205]|uniref:GGDEF domain-containing protein n=1 Tax=Erythrobacter sp. SCSIO 43205 TaxID=2779361 RepID=UPI001CA81DC3|nr:GGDEF domain-containing protein [Erythrobacter sp. SCSIO 43205]UAB78638.1 GGDEF domain-containing protein [Erythrobacter sp. SCSIO 43205]
MQWEQIFKPAALGSAALAGAILAFPAQAQILAQVQLLASTGSAAGSAAPAAPAASPSAFFIITTVLAIGLCLFIARRLWVVHCERDAAWEEVASLQALTERDPLTGLLNRRVVEERFETLRSQGFDTFALIDLDQFKGVNDRYGHQVGDDVLVACGDALRGSEQRDYLAMRLGGEEFVVLLRGQDAYFRAEALRETLPLKIARAVPVLEEPVTASMGLIELPRTGHGVFSFKELYRRADQLLYNAKASGRNRTCFERLTVFNNAPPSRGSAQKIASECESQKAA